jgi:hypothetical protein
VPSAAPSNSIGAGGGVVPAAACWLVDEYTMRTHLGGEPQAPLVSHDDGLAHVL